MIVHFILFAFKNLNRLVLKGELHSAARRTLGAARAQTCARGLTPLDPLTAKMQNWYNPTFSA